MKKVLLLSLLVLFGCSKDSEEATPGDEIIGTHQIINTISTWVGSSPSPNTTSWCCFFKGFLGEDSYLEFYPTKKGKLYASFLMKDETKNPYPLPHDTTLNFDWNYDESTQRWNIIDENNKESSINYYDSTYKMLGSQAGIWFK